ncbi:hypothetical protein ACSX1A_06855 [Pontibacter sp. MBLB2868]|uniref:hypothetical protein n=1 Tax=Pontibacter sp. MBLB2868 TaxID=3451555 RepID=UPI003F74C13F
MKFKRLQCGTQLRQRQISEAVLITKDSVLGYIKRQLEKGNWREVEEVVKGKPMTKAGKVLVTELRSRVVSNLMLRLGLRRVVAVGVAMLLIPLILAKVAGKIMYRTK